MKYDPWLSFRRIRHVLSMYVTMCGGSRFASVIWIRDEAVMN